MTSGELNARSGFQILLEFQRSRLIGELDETSTVHGPMVCCVRAPSGVVRLKAGAEIGGYTSVKRGGWSEFLRTYTMHWRDMGI